MEIKKITADLISALKKYKSVMICIKGSPDPDAIASSYALSVICSLHNIKSRIISQQKPSLPQNIAFINDLDIQVYYGDYTEKIDEYDAYCVLDFQSAIIEGLTGKIPCAVHIDHHEPLDEGIDINFNFVSEEIGATSTLLTFLIRHLHENFSEPDAALLKKITTALHYGIYVDTDSYRHAGDLDFEALHYVTVYSDKKIIDRITEIPMPKDILRYIGNAIKNKQEYKGWLFAGIGFIDENKRDSIAIVADFLVQRFSNVSLVIVFAGILKKNPQGLRLDASFRTEDENADMNRLIKAITVTGGGRKYKGAYQVDLNYFADCPDMDFLWKTIELTTINKFKNLRDDLRIIHIMGIYQNLKKRIWNIIG
jgi:nanoRNase/pAp phosphatase (c-di-AMP/oligoRNAs hydrolase)